MPTVALKKLVEGVEENGDFLVFYVESSQHGNPPYRVDLQKFCGNGDCDCPNFSLAKLIEQKGVKVSKRLALTKGAMPCPALECKHIRRAKRYLLFKVLNRLIEDREKETKALKEATGKDIASLQGGISRTQAVAAPAGGNASASMTSQPF